MARVLNKLSLKIRSKKKKKETAIKLENRSGFWI